MPFLNGRVSFARFRVVGPTPGIIDEAHLDALREGVFTPDDGPAPGELDVGWTGGEHIYDERFEHEHNVFAGGEVAHVGLRIDTNRVPAEIARAVKAQHRVALLEDASGRSLTRAQKHELKQMVDEALREELRSGRHRRSKLVPVVWDAERSLVLAASGANTIVEQLCAHWRTSPKGSLEPMSAGSMAHAHLAASGRSRDFEDLAPSAFTDAPTSELPAMPEVPWSRTGPEPHDFLGNEFLVWLWHRCDLGEGVFEVDGAEVAVVLDRSLDAECAWHRTGKLSLVAHESGIAPIRTPEAATALALGKWPRKAGLVLAIDGQPFSCTLAADRWIVTGAELPDPTEPAESPREAAEWRIEQTRRLDGALAGLFAQFIERRASDAWPGERADIRTWIRGRGRPRAIGFIEATSNEESPIRVAG
ncbi:MAG: hypothetical protein AAGI30_01945 [Planctomycetota bacterium]